MPPDSTGINFINQLTFDQEFNIYTYRNFYNGGGVGIADINNDGLVDLYFTANQKPNKLYLNKGNFKFEDITDKAKVAGTRAWSTGVSMADVNGDGWVDIYVCNSGDVKGDNKQNELFVNNGDLTFTERAKEFGVADEGFSTHAVFFDYDRDGDLDLYILNNSYRAIGSFNMMKNERGLRNKLGGDKLMRNDGNVFHDVSEQAHIYGSEIGFGLGVTVGDVNRDGWMDIYVSNDFFERDYLYINNQDGTFKEDLVNQMKSISGASMGADMADINNDALPDLFVTEMLPYDNARVKTVTTFENWDRYQYALANGYYHQFTRNMFQLNNGNDSFSEIGRLTGTEATDWSWGALIFDIDNDGFKDLYVSNGISQDLTNQDYLQFATSEEAVQSILKQGKVDYKKLVDLIPAQPVANFAFANVEGVSFKDNTKKWGLFEPSFSNGSAYGDFDNDGDLDLVVNNVNMAPFVYRNETEGNNFVKFDLKETSGHRFAIGAEVLIEVNGGKYYIEQMPIRGFQSSVDHRPNVGVGKSTVLDKITVNWPNGTSTVLEHVKVNQLIRLQSPARGTPPVTQVNEKATMFTDVTENLKFPYRHQENQFVDFDRDRLLFLMSSTEGPKVSLGDVNADGFEDIYIGGAKDQAGELLIQLPAGRFISTNVDLFEKDKISEDAGSEFFDADGDGDLDLYVCSGGVEFPSSSSALLDRLYLNNGSGEFKKSDALLPTNEFVSTSVVRATDFDKDGDLDLFVGEHLKPFFYGKPANGYLLLNDGKGQFQNKTSELAPELMNIGLIKDASWADVNGDGNIDLVIVGEWMPIKVLVNKEGKLSIAQNSGLQETNGWWNTIQSADIDSDGDVDFIAGNHGYNSRFRASMPHPVTMWVSDFDQNGTVEQVICTYNGDKSYPLALRHDLLAQMPSLKKKFLKYESYKDATIEDIFTSEQLKLAIKVEAFEFASSILLNDGQGKFTILHLPIEAQFSPTYAIMVDDIDKDGHVDLLLGGNLYRVKPEAGRYDASYGNFLKGLGNGKFKTMLNRDCGLKLDGEVRDIKRIKVGKDNLILVARNNNTPIFLK
ncbi:MAG: VCBS repeat-containing protein [Flammeovirgaceae bacterium]